MATPGTDGRVVAIHGVAGSGKTRLVHRLIGERPEWQACIALDRTGDLREYLSTPRYNKAGWRVRFTECKTVADAASAMQPLNNWTRKDGPGIALFTLDSDSEWKRWSFWQAAAMCTGTQIVVDEAHFEATNAHWLSDNEDLKMVFTLKRNRRNEVIHSSQNPVSVAKGVRQSTDWIYCGRQETEGAYVTLSEYAARELWLAPGSSVKELEGSEFLVKAPWRASAEEPLFLWDGITGPILHRLSRDELKAVVAESFRRTRARE